ncbi:MAG: hypothetical protein V3U09_05520 [Thermoplasmata archaeon]
MVDRLWISLKGVVSRKHLEWVFTAGSERHRIITQVTTGHEQEGFLELVGAKVG